MTRGPRRRGRIDNEGDEILVARRDESFRRAQRYREEIESMTEPILQFFEHAHLPPHLAHVTALGRRAGLTFAAAAAAVLMMGASGRAEARDVAPPAKEIPAPVPNRRRRDDGGPWAGVGRALWRVAPSAVNTARECARRVCQMQRAAAKRAVRARIAKEPPL